MDHSWGRLYVACLDDGRACFGAIREADLWQDSFRNHYPPRPRAVWLREGWHMQAMTEPNGMGSALLRTVDANPDVTPKMQHSEMIPWLGIAPSSQQTALWGEFERHLSPVLLNLLRGVTLGQPFGGLGQMMIENDKRQRVVGVIIGERQCVFQVESWDGPEAPRLPDTVIACVVDWEDFPANKCQVYVSGQVKPVRTATIVFG